MRNSNNRRTVKSILLVKRFLGLVEVTSELVIASFSFPEWQAVKMIFFAAWQKFLFCIAFSIYEVVRLACLACIWFVYAHELKQTY